MVMKRIDYVLLRFDGDYAYLRRVDRPEAEPKLVAIALLPEGAQEGSRLAFEMMEYTLLD